MKPPAQPLFLARKSYGRRRAADAARMLPFLGFLLWVVLPLLRNPAATPEKETAGAGILVFGVWIMLILASFLLSRALREPPEGQDAPPRASQAGGGDAIPDGSAQGRTPTQHQHRQRHEATEARH